MFKFNLPTSEWVSVLKGALVAGAGVALTYVVQHVTAADFGVYGPVVVGVLSISLPHGAGVSPTPAPLC